MILKMHVNTHGWIASGHAALRRVKSGSGSNHDCMWCAMSVTAKHCKVVLVSLLGLAGSCAVEASTNGATMHSRTATAQAAVEAVVSNLGVKAAVATSNIGEVGKAAYRRTKIEYVDDVSVLRSECSLLNEWCMLDATGTLVRTVPVLQATALACAGAGVLRYGRDIAVLSRAFMDTDRNGFAALLSLAFGAADVKRINTWMDTVPGSGMAGGWNHRIKHGHDIAALVTVFKEHDAKGAAAWLTHVALRDFWTPHGIPYLPVGSATVFDWLTSAGVPRDVAASMLSVNVWQIMGAIMAYHSARNMVQYVRDELDEREAKRLFDRAEKLYVCGDYQAANECYEEMLALVPKHKPVVELWTALRFYDMAMNTAADQALWRQHMLRTYNAASSVVRKLSRKDETVVYGGAELSMRGLAVVTMAAAWAGVLGEKDTYTFQGVLSSGIDDLVAVANGLRGRRLLPSRPFSAVANDVLALHLMYSSPFALSTSISPDVLHKRVVTTLETCGAAETEQAGYATNLLNGFRLRYPLGVDRGAEGNTNDGQLPLAGFPPADRVSHAATTNAN